jgi:nuclear cap-binding protein subunit 1
MQSLGLELVKVILFTIPYTMASSATGFESQAFALLDKTDIIASTPHTLESLVDPFVSNNSGESTGSQSALALLQKHMQDEAKQSWELACLPEKVETGPRPIFPEMYFSVYTEQDIETVPAASDTAAILLRDALTDTINILDCNRNVGAKFLIDIDCYFAPNTFVKRATPFDKLRELSGDRPTWKPEDVVVDAAFSQLLQLPAPEHKLVYYHSVLTEACKLAPAAIAPSLGRAIRFLYRNIEKMDLEVDGVVRSRQPSHQFSSLQNQD